jgi:hypothetical protein
MMYRVRMIDHNGQSRITRPITAISLERVLRRIERIAATYSIEFMEYPL